MDARFGKERRVRKRREFDRTFEQGRRVTTPHFVIVFALRDAEASGPSRLGLVVSRKAGNAVVRNRIKRLCREAFRRAPARVPREVDVLLIPRPGASALALAQVDRELEDGFARVRKILAKSPAPSHDKGPR